jgi:hypothetical protein
MRAAGADAGVAVEFRFCRLPVQWDANILQLQRPLHLLRRLPYALAGEEADSLSHTAYGLTSRATCPYSKFG